MPADGSNNYIAYSDNINIWREAKLLQQPKSPLLVPNAEEREGYVPNVVYSCGSMIHNDELIIPYAMSDYASTYATVNLQELLNELKKTNQDV